MPYIVSLYQWIEGTGYYARVIICTKDIDTITLEARPNYAFDCPSVNGGNSLSDDCLSIVTPVEIGKYNYDEGGQKTFDCSSYDYISIKNGGTSVQPTQHFRVVSWT